MMSVVNLVGTAPGVGCLDTRDNGVMGSEGELSPVHSRWVNMRKHILKENAPGESV